MIETIFFPPIGPSNLPPEIAKSWLKICLESIIFLITHTKSSAQLPPLP